MRGRILLAFEAAERERDPAKLKAWMTFVIVGGGPTGAELAGALGEIAHDTLSHDFRDIDPSQTQIILVEGADRALPSYPPKLSEAARKMLVKLGVMVRTGAMVINIQADSVTIKEGDRTESIPIARCCGPPEFWLHRSAVSFRKKRAQRSTRPAAWL